MLRSLLLAQTLKDRVSVNVKHTNNRIKVGLLDVGVILWNTICLQRLTASGEHAGSQEVCQSCNV